MVFAFIIKLMDDEIPDPYLQVSQKDLNVSPVGYFHSFFTPEGNDSNRTERSRYIITKLEKHFSFRRNCAENIAQPLTHISEEGIFPIAQEFGNDQLAKSLFKTQKIVIWKQVASVFYIMVLEPLENTQLAVQFLHNFPNLIDDNFKRSGMSAHPKEFLNRPEEFLIFLHTFLPQGQLRFQNEYFTRFLRKDFESILQKT